MNRAGVVVELWRYPVKSMLGEECESVDVSRRGIEGDRLFAIRDANGKFGSGKTTRRFRHIDGLFGFRASYRGTVPEIVFPNGSRLRGDDALIDTTLSEALHQPVTLAEEAAISHMDVGPLHVLTTASLAWLKAALPDAQLDERRFRPNVLIDVPGDTQVERDWLGRTLAIGNEVVVRVTSLTERCNMVNFAQSELPAEPKVLRHIAREGNLQFGVYAEVLKTGKVRRGDPATIGTLDK
jgi:uncharacterized protein YcbX